MQPDHEMRHNSKEFMLSGKEKRETDIKFKKFGAAYITAEEIQKTVVRLSENGYQELYLKRIARQRPIPVSEPKVVEHNGKQYYELEFDCSHQQIHNYFFSYGVDAEIIAPAFLRSQFKNRYEAAVQLYQNDVNEEENN